MSDYIHKEVYVWCVYFRSLYKYAKTDRLCPWMTERKAGQRRSKMSLLLLLSVMTISVEGACRYVEQHKDQVVAYCHVAAPEDYTSISLLDAQTTDLILNITGRFEDKLVSFDHLHQLQSLKFEPSTRYSSYEMAKMDHANSDFTRVDIFEQLIHLRELRINIVLTGFKWSSIKYLSQLRVLDVSYTQIRADLLRALLKVVKKYKLPLESVSMVGMQRLDIQRETQPIKTEDDIYTFLQYSPVKLLDLRDNLEITAQPGLSIYLPQLEVLRVGADYFLTIKEGPDPLLKTCIAFDLLLHPSVREYTIHFARHQAYRGRHKRGLLDHFFGNPKHAEQVLKKIQHCDITQNISGGNILCSVVNCLCGDLVTFPCDMFQGISLSDIFVHDKACVAGLRLPLPPFLERLVMTRGVWFSSKPMGPVCFNPNNKLTYLDLTNSGIRGWMVQDFRLKGLKKMKYVSLQNNQLKMTENVSIVEDMPSLEVLLLGQNSINLTFPDKMDFMRASSLRSLDMQECSIGIIPENSFLQLTRLEYLNVSGNGLESFDVNLTALQHLKHLNISNNLLKNIGEELRMSLDKLAVAHNVTLDLSDNPLECNCHNLYLLSWLKTTKVSLARLNLTTCKHTMGGIKMSIPDINLEQFYRMCIHFDVIISCVGSSLGVSLILSVGFLIYKRRWRFRYWMHVANEAIRRRHARKPYDNLTNHFIYDAFVAYSSRGEERPWVHTMLREKLEGEHGLKLCMYHRDFKVGRDLADTIVEGINSSSKILLILSPTFLSSCWCEFEVRMSNEKVVKERRDAVILVVFSKLDQAGARLPRKLARLLEKRIYIEWTEDPDGQKLFWSRLVQAIKKDETYDAFGDMCDISNPQ